MSKEKDIIEMPCVTISNDKECITVHNYTNLKGRIVLDKAEASLLMIELWKFINAT
jgi:hypothetical protein